ncbi:MAG: hypothetical protein O2793_16260 [Proteobacteria bacterium]|nr:hypothetical protein [Pseudomonadota bacterium]MDA1255966.1 hypothetical protein [Pseudomonadota bacterium]
MGVELSTAEQMPAQYALAFLIEKMESLKKLKHERQNSTHAEVSQAQSTNTKSYVATERKHSTPKTGEINE